MQDPRILPIEGPSLTDTRLLRAAVDNDQTAWRDLVESYSGRVYRWARHAGLQDSDAADVTNQVFLSVARGLAEFKREGKSYAFRGWLHRITLNAIAALQRTRTRQVCDAAGGTDQLEVLEKQLEPMPASTRTSPAPQPSSREAAAVERVRRLTSPEVWRLFWLVTAEELDPEDVARQCQVKVSAVYLAKHRLAKRIREELERSDS